MVKIRRLKDPKYLGYAVGEDGSIWTCKNARWGFRDTWRQLKPHLNSRTGYLLVGFSNKSGSYWSDTVHQLVAMAWLGFIRGGLYQVNHKDGNKLNNHRLNLEVVSRSENQTHAVKTGLLKPNFVIAPPSGSKNCKAILTEPQVIELRRLWDTGEFTPAELRKQFGVRGTTFHDIVNRKTWRHV